MEDETPVAATEAAPQVTAPVVEAPAVAASVVEAPPSPTETPAITETVLGEALKDAPTSQESTSTEPVVETKPEETKKETTTETEKSQSDEPAPPPVFEAFTMPEGFAADEAQLKEFTDILSKFETDSKAKHELVQKFGQEAVDYHVKQVQKAVNDLTQFYAKSWEDQKVAWKESFLADPEIGGNRFQTTVDSALSFIRTHGGTPEQQTEFRQLMDTSGLGNHPIMIRILANAGKAMSEGRPLAANAPTTPPKSKTETLYGSKKNYIGR